MHTRYFLTKKSAKFTTNTAKTVSKVWALGWAASQAPWTFSQSFLAGPWVAWEAWAGLVAWEASVSKEVPHVVKI